MPRPAPTIRAFLAVAIGLGVAAAASTPLYAETIDRRVHRACKDDYKRLCPRYKVSSPQLRSCMEAKSHEISSDCVGALIESGMVDDRGGKRR